MFHNVCLEWKREKCIMWRKKIMGFYFYIRQRKSDLRIFSVFICVRLSTDIWNWEVWGKYKGNEQLLKGAMKFMGNLPGKRLVVCNQKCRPTVNNFFNDRRSRKYLIAFLQDLPALIFLSIPLIINVTVTIVTICMYHINCSLNSG